LRKNISAKVAIAILYWFINLILKLLGKNKSYDLNN